MLLAGKTHHEIVALAVRVRVAVTRDACGRVVGLECLQADDIRGPQVEWIDKRLKAGARVPDMLIRLLAAEDILRALVRIEQEGASDG
jgi:hypothetical protein